MTDRRGGRARRTLGRVGFFVVAVVLVAVLWDLYKLVGPARGGDVLGWRILPSTSDLVMPHSIDIFRRLFQPTQPGFSELAWQAVLAASWYSFRLAMLGLVVGALVGVALAVVSARFSVARRGLLPYLVASQTVPLIALAPIMVSWTARLSPFGWRLPWWTTVSLMSAFLAFFPVAVGTLRGLTSLPSVAEELLRSYAASWRKTLFTVRFPAALPHMAPAFRLAASAAVIGAIVAEISTGIDGGIGRLVIAWAGQRTSDPPKGYTPAFGAAALGLVAVGVIVAAEAVLMRNRPKESTHDR